MAALEKKEFQRLLFQSAFCLMACDGHIDDREVAEIKRMDKDAIYFQGIDLSNELVELLNDLKNKGKQIVEKLFKALENLNLSTVQELLILEVSFRLIHADEKVTENEIKFIRLLRSKLNLHDEIIRDRFGAVVYLFDKDYSKDIVKEESHKDLFSTLAIPEFKVLAEYDFSRMTKE